MSRTFSKEVKRAALLRSGKRCEAVGPLYGLPEGERCNANLGAGFEFDHLIPWALSRDSGAGNCVVSCPVCHRKKTTKNDVPRIAKAYRQRDKNDGITTSRNPLPGGRKSPWKKTFSGKVVAR